MLAVCLFFSISTSSAQPVVVDGWFEDWRQPAVSSTDPINDSTGPFDIKYVAARTNGTRLYVRFRLANPCGLQNGPDKGSAAEEILRLIVLSAGSDTGIAVDFRNRTVSNYTEQDVRYSWADLSYMCLPTFASEDYELSLDTASIGFKVGDHLQLNFEGCDSLPIALNIKLEPELACSNPSEAKAIERSGEVRVSCFNTFSNGLSDLTRRASISRLMAAIDSDVYCFVEEDDESAFAQSVRQVVPHNGNLSVSWRGGKGIASRIPLQSISCQNDASCCAAMLTARSGRRFILFVAHLDCCGYPDSPEDKERVRQAESIAACVKRLRSGAEGAMYKDLPVIVVGDFNLVGSRQPLSILETRGGLTEARLRSLSGMDGITWRDPESGSYAPGRLDYLTYDARRLRRTGGGILDSGAIRSSLATRLKLEAKDSFASDHLLIFADFDVLGQTFTTKPIPYVTRARPSQSFIQTQSE